MNRYRKVIARRPDKTFVCEKSTGLVNELKVCEKIR